MNKKLFSIIKIIMKIKQGKMNKINITRHIDIQNQH